MLQFTQHAAVAAVWVMSACTEHTHWCGWLAPNTHKQHPKAWHKWSQQQRQSMASYLVRSPVHWTAAPLIAKDKKIHPWTSAKSLRFGVLSIWKTAFHRQTCTAGHGARPVAHNL